MGLESASYIASLDPANPTGTDAKSEGDDHIRLLKTAARNSFPGFPGVVAGTGVESGSGAAFAVTLSPAPAAYTAGMMVVFKAAHANSGPATLQVNALAAKTLKAVDGSALESGDIESGAIVGAFYDGTDFFLISGTDRAARGGDSYTGTHDFTGAAVQVATAGAGDNSAKAASTAYVDAADALKANLASPALSGVPTAPTAAPGTNTTQVATTAFATQLAFQAVLPAQAGETGKFLQTDGTSASWENLSNLSAAKSADYAVLTTDRYKAFDLTGSHTLSLPAAATAGDGFIVYVRNGDVGVWAIDPSGAETIDGLATIKVYQESFALVCNGVSWRCFGRDRGPILVNETVVGSTVASVDIEAGFDDTEFKSFFAIMVDITGSVSTRPFLRVKKSGSYLSSPSYGSYGYDAAGGMRVPTTSGGGASTGINLADSNPALVSVSKVSITNPFSVAASRQLFEITTLIGSNVWIATGRESTAASIQGIRLIFETGDVTGGTIRLYGVR